MYTEDDLNQAVQEGIIDAQVPILLRQWTEGRNHSVTADEENFKLIGSFNDIFVVIASVLLLSAAFGTVSLLTHLNSLASLVVAGLSWGLAEFFTRQRRMALPSILLLLTWVVGLAWSFLSLGELMSAAVPGGLMSNLPSHPWLLILGAVAVSGGTWAHWRRFRVPITVAAGSLALLGLLLCAPLAINPLFYSQYSEFTPWLILLAGLLLFAWALFWDRMDLERKNWRSDVAFWLHLAASPMIVHPLFHLPGVDLSIVATLGIYLFLALVALVVDRRAFLVSALIYVIYSLNQLFHSSMGGQSEWVYGALILGSFLLCLSAFWQILRRLLLHRLPVSWRARFPAIRN